ncbi:TonB-dependent receptor [Chitinophaga sp. HK235]|uniref:TonB-dependent receptor n=1 Tax=Chitinophaga sp. HK235 TaxID=2952571 RepID=UPI001BA4C6C3|nr:TonB-dependent receptor [Chitinophaga sp. HK235]
MNTLEIQLHYSGILKRDRFEKLPTGLYKGNEGIVNAYHLFNLNASYRVSHSTRLTLGIENLFNADYFPARSQWFMIPGFYAKGKGAAFNIGVVVNY